MKRTFELFKFRVCCSFATAGGKIILCFQLMFLYCVKKPHMCRYTDRFIGGEKGF